MSNDDFKKISPVVLVGGSGERLWPISRFFYPKPFVDFDKQGSMFQKTVARIQGMGKAIIIGNETWYTLLRYYGHHGLLLFYGLESILGGFRPTLTNYINAIKMTSYIIITISLFNILAGSNYMFTRSKPDGVNFTILMPEWPGYLIIILALGLIFYSILYFCGKKKLEYYK